MENNNIIGKNLSKEQVLEKINKVDPKYKIKKSYIINDELIKQEKQHRNKLQDKYKVLLQQDKLSASLQMYERIDIIIDQLQSDIIKRMEHKNIILKSIQDNTFDIQCDINVQNIKKKLDK